MTAITSLIGRYGKFAIGSTAVARATKWDVNASLASKSEWGDSDSAGYTNRAPGRLDATFDTEGKYDTASEQFDLFMPGDYCVVGLWQDTTSVVYWAFPRALCSDFKLSVNIDSEEVIGWQASWGADGIFYRPGQSGAPVYTIS